MDDVPKMLEDMLAALPQLRALQVSFWTVATTCLFLSFLPQLQPCSACIT